MAEMIEEEMMALEAIFYDSFSKISEDSFRVRVDPESRDESSSEPPPFFLEFHLPAGYPEVAPSFELGNINNSKYTDSAKNAIREGLQEEARAHLGDSMCYTLVEWLKERLADYYAMRPAAAPVDDESDEEEGGPSRQAPVEGKKKGGGDGGEEKMTKAQKRRYYDRFGAHAEKPRGWNWVCITSHLSQGPQHTTTA